MTRIAVDTFSTRPPWHYGGIYEYTRLLLHHLGTLAPEFGCDVTALVGSTFKLRNELRESASLHIRTAAGIDRARFWRYGGCGLQALRSRSDIVFLPAPDVLPVFMPPYVVTIHDIPFVDANSFSRFKNWRLRKLIGETARRAAKILANSEYTKRDIIRHLNIAPEKIVVAYLGLNHANFNGAPLHDAERQLILERHNLRCPYIVHHGTLQPRKNVRRLVEAYRLMLDRHPHAAFDLVLMGAKYSAYDVVLAEAQRVRPPGRVIFTGLLQEGELSALVKAASLCVIPSLHEGFCLPMLEAMACGVPTITADNSCLPEVSGGVLRYFNAQSVEEIAETMYGVLQSPAEQNRLRQAGLARAAEFSWERCARETFQTLRDAGGGD